MKEIIEHINAILLDLGWITTAHGLCYLISTLDNETEIKTPVEYGSKGEPLNIADLATGVSWHRMTSETSYSEGEAIDVDKVLLERTYSIRLVLSVTRDIRDDQYLPTDLVETLVNKITSNNVDKLRDVLKASEIRIIPVSDSTDTDAILAEEFEGQNYPFDSDFVLVALNYNVTVVQYSDCMVDLSC